MLLLFSLVNAEISLLHLSPNKVSFNQMPVGMEPRIGCSAQPQGVGLTLATGKKSLNISISYYSTHAEAAGF